MLNQRTCSLHASDKLMNPSSALCCVCHRHMQESDKLGYGQAKTRPCAHLRAQRVRGSSRSPPSACQRWSHLSACGTGPRRWGSWQRWAGDLQWQELISLSVSQASDHRCTWSSTLCQMPSTLPACRKILISNQVMLACSLCHICWLPAWQRKQTWERTRERVDA